MKREDEHINYEHKEDANLFDLIAWNRKSIVATNDGHKLANRVLVRARVCVSSSLHSFQSVSSMQMCLSLNRIRTHPQLMQIFIY